tara:strand:- start:429 stop:710 length:282 start_codon:yes stop_codon:yes gene_type:complete
MITYFCPFCKNKIKLNVRAYKTELVCKNCGEDLVKEPLIKFKKITALIAVLSLVIPIVFSLVFSIKNLKNENKEYIQAYKFNDFSILLFTFFS